MDEFEIIRRHFTQKSCDESVALGVGDDGAVLRPDCGKDLVSVIDTLVEEIHFPRAMRPRDIAYRAVAVNVSDVAAMGARSRWMICALTLREASDAWLTDFSFGLQQASQHYQVHLVRVDTTHGKQCVVSMQISGDVQKGKAIVRSGAQPGDAIFVSGTPGDAALGLSILQEKLKSKQDIDHGHYLIRRFTKPTAHAELGRRLVGKATAAIDVSDGLYADLSKLLEASGVGGEIEVLDLPLSDFLRREVSLDDGIGLALGGGDDYELCFTAPDDSITTLDEQAGVPVTRIGKVTLGPELSCLRDGKPMSYHDTGYLHFSD